MLDFDNLNGYQDAETYDLLNDLEEIEKKFFLDLAQKQGSPILDIACGTGRMTLPLAELGFDMTGLDLTSEMLKLAKQKAELLNLSVDWVHGDARNFMLDRKYRFIFTTGNSFQHFLDRASVEGFLQSVYNHLDDDGILAFETRNPTISVLNSNDNLELDAGSWIDQHGYNCNSTYRRSYDHQSQLEHYLFTNRRWKEKSDVEETIEPFVIRYFFPQELESLLYYSGFELIEMYGNFDKSPFNAESVLMVCVCRKRK